MKSLLIISILLLSGISISQNLEKVGKKEMVTVSGGINFNTTSYAADGIASRREPFTWVSSGNVTFSVLDISLPFTFRFTNAGSQYTQPFNMTSFNPKYKWAQAFIGITSMSFSKYTLAGRQFAGAGIELTPGKWKFKAMAGRINKAIEYDEKVNNLNTFTYKRFGYGLSTSYNSKGYEATVIIFKAKDDPNSITFIPLESTNNPQDNLVISVGGKAKITKFINIDAEYALSGVTENLRVGGEPNVSKDIALFDPLISGNASTNYFNAFNSGLNFNLKFAKVALKYERVDPRYTTLGGFYFANDLENWTIAPSTSLFKKKVTLALNVGIQRDNLDRTKQTTSKRWVGNVNINFAPNKSWNFSTTYSNFSSFSQNRPPGDPFYNPQFDTLNFYQVNQNASFSAGYRFGKKNVKSSMNLMTALVQSNQLQGALVGAQAYGINTNGTPGPQTNVYTGNLSYNASFTEQKLTLTLASNANYSVLATTNTLFIGPSLNVAKPLFKEKVTFSAGATYNRQYQAGDLSNNVFNYRTSAGMSPEIWDKKYGSLAVALSGNLLQKEPIETTQNRVLELTVMANLSYSFK